MANTLLQSYLPAIRALESNRPLTKQDLLTASFLVETEDMLSMYYAPHNETININAQIVLVGITPGWQQMKTALETFVQNDKTGETMETCLTQAKNAAGFAGTMRQNLTTMLDQCGIPDVLGMPHAADMFGKNRSLLHTTSVIKYPVFKNGQNYTGHQPPINRSTLLQRYAFREFPDELATIQKPALVIPLGKAVDHVLVTLQQEHKLPGHTYLTGFPHPSGANGHRTRQIRQQKKQLQAKIKAWAASRHAKQ